MKQKIKEKVLKKLEKNFPYTTCAIAINETIDLTLVEVGKVIDKLLDNYVYGDNPPHFSINEDNIDDFKEELKEALGIK